ncbi:DNA methylase [Curtobacterium sp. MCJR17_055]|uniref:type I restriction-modification system subunit M n=1 Tax=unclassified Curtobacterium TaxID=257496 RepID=UPI000D915F8B|nr:MULTISPECIES: class I SAM-dependent DNA methyltransferase [unclassified Curtobacterium]PYY33784.1 DNA methylase [Curtobacterium sp. MCBD17_029]PYY58746.1 DNA methylase [Curtobacterium sp. MCJR17_055]PYY59713.1 DNA methylase [Curtobacterium sp. MCPF17_015]
MTLVPATPDHLTQRELEQALWAAANALRGPVDPGDFKAYVFPVLFYKWISDVYDYRHDQAVEELGDGWTQEIEEEDYQTFLVPDGAHWDDTYGVTKRPGAALNKALVSTQEANPGKLSGVFGDVNWANTERIPESALRALMGVFARLTLDPAHVSGDMLGSAYEYLLREFAEASGKKAGEFFTPRHVVHLLVKILNPQPGDSICDPACGSAGMLVETVEAVKLAGANPDSLLLYGQEQNLTTAGIARMNLYLHGLEDFEIKRGDTFREPKLLDETGELRKFDIVIANPPFSLDNWPSSTWGKDKYKRALGGIVPPAKSGDWAWIQHMLATMKDDTGRVGVVMPHGALFRGGRESDMRRWVIEKDLLEAVIGLPNNLFYSTSIPVSLLIFRASKTVERQGQVLFIDARARFKPGRNQNILDDDDVDSITTSYVTGTDADGAGGVNVSLVARDEIQSNDYDLNIGRYIQTETKAEANVDAALAALREAQERMNSARAALDARLREAGFDA